MIIDKVLIIVSAFIKNKQGKVLLLQRSEKSSYPGYWQLAEGKLEKNESLQDSLKREINEEIGINLSQMEFNTVSFNEIEAKGLKYLCFRIVFKAKIYTKNIVISDEHVAFGWFYKQEIQNLKLLPGIEKLLGKLM